MLFLGSNASLFPNKEIQYSYMILFTLLFTFYFSWDRLTKEEMMDRNYSAENMTMGVYDADHAKKYYAKYHELIRDCSYMKSVKFMEKSEDLCEWPIILFVSPHEEYRKLKKCNYQTWIVLTHESPINYHLTSYSDTWLENADYVISYDENADFYSPYLSSLNMFNFWATLHLPLSFDEVSESELCSCVISNSNAHNNRNQIILKLHSYGISIASYGKWWNNKNGVPVVKTVILRRHLFNLCFENSNFEDYVTEKIYESFEASVIPVYYGAQNIAKYIPPHSAILVQDFPSISALASHLLYLRSNRSAYLEYFSWKSPSILTPWLEAYPFRTKSSSCSIFDRIHNRLLLQSRRSISKYLNPFSDLNS